MSTPAKKQKLDADAAEPAGAPPAAGGEDVIELSSGEDEPVRAQAMQELEDTQDELDRVSKEGLPMPRRAAPPPPRCSVGTHAEQRADADVHHVPSPWAHPPAS